MPSVSSARTLLRFRTLCLLGVRRRRYRRREREVPGSKDRGRRAVGICREQDRTEDFGWKGARLRPLARDRFCVPLPRYLAVDLDLPHSPLGVADREPELELYLFVGNGGDTRDRSVLVDLQLRYPLPEPRESLRVYRYDFECLDWRLVIPLMMVMTACTRL